MLEFVFRRAELDALIKESGSPDSGNVVIRLAFSPPSGDDKVFPARVIAFCEDSTGKVISDDKIYGCPRPPGCD